LAHLVLKRSPRKHQAESTKIESQHSVGGVNVALKAEIETHFYKCCWASTTQSINFTRLVSPSTSPTCTPLTAYLSTQYQYSGPTQSNRTQLSSKGSLNNAAWLKQPVLSIQSKEKHLSPKLA